MACVAEMVDGRIHVRLRRGSPARQEARDENSGEEEHGQKRTEFHISSHRAVSLMSGELDAGFDFANGLVDELDGLSPGPAFVRGGALQFTAVAPQLIDASPH